MSRVKAYAVLDFAIGLSVKFLSRENYIYIIKPQPHIHLGGLKLVKVSFTYILYYISILLYKCIWNILNLVEGGLRKGEFFYFLFFFFYFYKFSIFLMREEIVWGRKSDLVIVSNKLRINLADAST